MSILRLRIQKQFQGWGGGGKSWLLAGLYSMQSLSPPGEWVPGGMAVNQSPPSQVWWLLRAPFNSLTGCTRIQACPLQFSMTDYYVFIAFKAAHTDLPWNYYIHHFYFFLVYKINSHLHHCGYNCDKWTSQMSNWYIEGRVYRIIRKTRFNSTARSRRVCLRYHAIDPSYITLTVTVH